MKFRLLTILFCLGALAQVRAQSNSIYSIAPMAVCWTTPANVDSNLIAYWLFSSRSTTPQVVSYLTASGTAVVVAGGTVSNGFCCCNGGSQDTLGIEILGDTLILTQNNITYTYIGGAGDDDWRWVDPGADETMYEAIYRMGKASIFTQDTSYAFQVDSTYRFRTDNNTSIFEWMRGTEGLINYKSLMFRAPGGATGAPQNDANNITIARTNTTTTRTNLGNLKFAAPYTGGSGAYRVGAQISALDELGGNDTTGVVLDFWTRQQGESFIRNTMTLEGDGRLELDRYNLFEDGVPERMLGYDDTDKDVKVSDITGNAQPNQVLGINALGTGMEWKDPDTLGRNGIYGGSGQLIETTNIDANGFSLNYNGVMNFTSVSPETFPITFKSLGGWDGIDFQLNTGANSAYGDLVGGFQCRPRYNGGINSETSSVFGRYTGNGTNRRGEMVFASHNGSGLIFSGVFGGDTVLIQPTSRFLSKTAEFVLTNSTIAARLKFYEPSGSGTNSVYWTTGPISADIGFINPNTVGTLGQALITDGNNPAQLSFATLDASITNEGSLTVAAGTGTTSVINSNTSGSTPLTISAAEGLAISEAGSTITLGPEAVQTDTVVLNSTWVNIGANKLRVHKRLGLVSIQGFIRGATIGTSLPGSPDVELPFGGFLVSNGFQCVANDDGVLKSVAVQDINGNLSFQSLSGGSIDLSGGSDYLFFSITYYNP